MKAIILAAGEGTRLRPLTQTTPKPLLKIIGKTIIEHNLKHIAPYIDECIIVTKYLKDLFPTTLWYEKYGIPLSYEIQNDAAGTAAALQSLDLKDDIIILNGDDIYDPDDLKKLCKFKGYGILAKQVENPEIYGILQIEENARIRKIVEKPTEYIGNLANAGAYKVPSNIFDICRNIPLSSRGEYEITDALSILLKTHTLSAIEMKWSYISIGYAWNLLDASEHFLKELKKSDIQGEIETGVVIEGNIILEEGAIIKSGTRIEGNCYFGKNSVIGPNAYVRGYTSLWEKGKIGFCVEVKNSYIGDHSKIPHLSYYGDSIMGNYCNLWGGFKVANLRHDGKNISVMVKGKLVDSGKRKLWCIIWDNVKTGINTQVYPGRILETSATTAPGEIIR